MSEPTRVTSWSADAAYTSGETVSVNGRLYKANWWTQGTDPTTNSGATGSGQPWSVVPASADNGVARPADSSQEAPVPASRQPLTPGSASASTAVFSPYVDLSLYSSQSLPQMAKASGSRNLTLGFIQSSGAGTIGWAGRGSIDNDTAPGRSSTIREEISALQATGGKVTISIGGANGTDPAVAAAASGMSAAQLASQYQSVINRYGVTSLDFDVEGPAQNNQASLQLRDQALVILKNDNPGLRISYTVPVTPTGLDQSGLNVIQTAIKNGVEIDVVNIMAMDYGNGVNNGGAMALNTIEAIRGTERQLASIGANSKIGVTVMIGQNDVSSEVFTLEDAQLLADYVSIDPNVSLLSMWSLTRDNGSTAGKTAASPTGSGLSQNPYDFALIFAQATASLAGGQSAGTMTSPTAAADISPTANTLSLNPT